MLVLRARPGFVWKLVTLPWMKRWNVTHSHANPNEVLPAGQEPLDNAGAPKLHVEL